MSTGINMKAGKIDEKSLEMVKDTILAILDCGNDESTIQCALHVFQATCPKSTIDGTSISYCNMNFSEGGEQTEPTSD